MTGELTLDFSSYRAGDVISIANVPSFPITAENITRVESALIAVANAAAAAGLDYDTRFDRPSATLIVSFK